MEQMLQMHSFGGLPPEEALTVTVHLIYDDQTNNAVALLINNPTSRPGAGVITKKNGNVATTFNVLPNTDNERQNLPNNLTVQFDARGNIRGWNSVMTYPSN